MTRGAALSLTLLLLASAATAQPSAALGHYRHGLSLYERDDLPGALQEFQQAYAIGPNPQPGDRIGMHFEDYDPEFQIGRVYARLGNFDEASRFFESCAAKGYTKGSQNAEEFRRWRGVVRQALEVRTLAARAVATPLPTRVAAPAPTLLPTATTLPEPTRAAVTTMPAVAAQRTAPPPTTRPISPVATTAPAAASSAATRPPPTAAPTTAFSPASTPPAPLEAAPSFWEGRAALAALAAALILAALAAWQWSRARRGFRTERDVGFGRYAITGLLGVGRSSFVYDARDRKKGTLVALRVRRPDRPATRGERFRREAEALESANRHDAVPAPRLLMSGVEKVGRATLPYLVLERLSGRNLFDVSRSARRRLDALLCVEILRSVARGVRAAREAGLMHEELTAEDIFLVEPVPQNAGNPIHLKILGLSRGKAEKERDAVALASIAAELFRGRARAWEDDDSVPDYVPAPLRPFLARATKGDTEPPPSLEELEAAIERALPGAPKGRIV